MSSNEHPEISGNDIADEIEDAANGGRVAAFGNYGVFSPYESHDGDVGWTVQRLSSADGVEPDDHGEIIAEFSDELDARFFAEAKAERCLPQVGIQMAPKCLWHTNCPKWMPESHHGQNTSAIMREVHPLQSIEIDDGSKLWLVECLHCGVKCFIGHDASRRVTVRMPRA